LKNFCNVVSTIFHSIFRISANSSVASDLELSFTQTDLFGNLNEDEWLPSKSPPQKRKLLSETVGGHQASR